MNQSPPKVTIQVVTHNSAKDLAPLLASLRDFTSAAYHIRFIDNNSSDDSVALIKKALPNAAVISLPQNTGYSGGHNIGFAACTTPFVLVLNPDTTLHKQGVAEILSAMESQPEIGAIQGLILREEEVIVDSAGIKRTITLNGVDVGSGNAHTNQYRKQVQIDGVTGACGLMRMKALKEVAYGSYKITEHDALEVFDKDFFAYKEDVDLGWRLQKHNWSIVFL